MFSGIKNLLAAWNRNNLEKLIVAQPVETLLPLFHDGVRKGPRQDLILN
jgi:hypothetical protein